MSEGQSRREFLKSAGRLLAAGGIGFLALRLLGIGRRDTREICVNEGVCRGCSVFHGCGLPSALSARQRAPWAGGADVTRREFLRAAFGSVAGISVVGLTGLVATRSAFAGNVWQIDPDVCVQCGTCSKSCVLAPSAVKAVHAYDVCGYCDLCSGYLQPGAQHLDTSAESRLCPAGAIRRPFVEDPYYEYTIDESLCIGCAKCVKGCDAFGNGSLFLQVRHERCANCNSCAAARSCPSGAIKRVSARHPYLLKGKGRNA